jgi:preprotein translocase subunit SecD
VARSGTNSRPGRALLALVVLLAVIFGAVAVGATTSNASWTPKLALDLEGGTEMILQPKAQAGAQKKITADSIREAVNIIRQRVNGSGVSEAEVTTQGSGGNQAIVVSLPGTPDQKTRNLVKQSAAMSFRPVLVASAAAPVPTPSATGTATPAPSGSAKPGATPKSTSKPSTTATSKRVVPQALTKAGATSPAGSTAAPTAADADPSAAATPGTTAETPPTDPNAPAGASDAAKGTASDLAQITPDLEKQFTAETCSDLDKLQAAAEPMNKPIVTCSTDGLQKYILGPVEVEGSHISSASAGIGTNRQGFSTGQWQVNLNFDSTGTKQFAAVTERLAGLTGAQNQFAIVLDRLVVSAPGTNERIPTGQAEISGSFNQTTATQLAQQLKFGALPVSFTVQTENQISALLGAEQLQRGLLAGLIGLILVVIYSLLQYRALGLVTIFSLVIAAAITYGLVLVLSWTQGYRLSLPGVTGLIVAIGITADSFIVYFERVRDEVRDGRPLKSAVEAAWTRARRTILASDAVNFLAAVVLYLLAVGGVRGFAFTLGLTTLVDVLVVFLFTKPAVTLLSRTEFFGGGHRFSGFSPEQLGRVTAYAGRGRVREPAVATAAGPAEEAGFEPGAPRSTGDRQGIAARRAARLAEEQRRANGDPPDGTSDSSVAAGRPSRRDS